MLIWISLNNRGTWFGDRIQDMNSNYLYFLRRDLGPNMWFTLENSHRLLRKRCALECLGGIFYSYLLGWFDLWGYLTPAFFWLIFFSGWLVSWWKWVLKTPTSTLLLINGFKSPSVSFMKIGTLCLVYIYFWV